MMFISLDSNINNLIDIATKEIIFGIGSFRCLYSADDLFPLGTERYAILTSAAKVAVYLDNAECRQPYGNPIWINHIMHIKSFSVYTKSLYEILTVCIIYIIDCFPHDKYLHRRARDFAGNILFYYLYNI